ncbi:MAG: preprotein translocase subunit SecE [Candidatus Izemoplasmatales bacterium]
MADIKKAKAPKAEKAVKVKETKTTKFSSQEEKHSRVMEILKKEYTVENWLLAILSPILLLYGVYIAKGSFGSVDLTAILGNSGVGFIDFFFQTDTARIIVGIVLIVIGALVILYLVYPILLPSIHEMKKVSWPSMRQLGGDTSKVFAFLLFLMLVFTLYGYALEPLFKWLYSL